MFTIKRNYMLWRMHSCFRKRDKAFKKGDYAKSAHYQNLTKHWMDKILDLHK